MTVTEPIAQTRAADFRRKLEQKIIVADGAMGTMLYAKGIFINRCFDELNLSSPQLVKEIHQEYVRVGAEVVETNTFGGNRIRLTAFGFAEKLRAINEAGVKLAREAAGERAFVAGAMGPLGTQIEPLGPLSFSEARDVFREQADVLVGAGVDVIGVNCSAGPKVALETVEKMVPLTTKPLSAMPNAGLPATVEGRNIYLCSPEYMAEYARRFLQVGVHVIGGCCGTTPEHIKMICGDVRSLQP